jgi:hypothetical protein
MLLLASIVNLGSSPTGLMITFDFLAALGAFRTLQPVGTEISVPINIVNIEDYYLLGCNSILLDL